MTDWRIRPAALADVPALAACIDAAYASYRNAGIELPDVSGGLADDLTKHRVFVAAAALQILGGVVVGISAQSAQLINIAVHPDHGGKGIGRALIDKAEDVAIRSGALEFQLATHVDMPGNIALYQHLGWVEVARKDTKVMMAKSL